MAQPNTLPVLSESGLSHYIAEVNKFPMLTFEEEQELANRWIKNEDLEAAHQLVTSHLRLVVKQAQGFSGYGLPINELIAEGNIGLMQAVKRFDPDKGFRLSTYAMWWIKAAMNEYVLRSWSLVKVGSSAAQKKLFFNLRKLKNRITGAENRSLSASEVQEIADTLDVSSAEVIEMEQRLGSRDYSLNAPVNREDEQGDWVDFMPDSRPSQEVVLAASQEKRIQRQMLNEALGSLNEREKSILLKRRMQEPPATLEDLSQEYNISRERVRQIENRAVEKLQAYVLEHAQKKQLLLPAA